MRKALSTAGWLLTLVGILLSIIFGFCFDHNFYRHEYAIYGQAEVIRMSDEDLMKATDTLLDYLQDKRDDIVVEAEVNGIEREVFNERETLHMVDVKNLYQNALTWRWIMLAAGIGILVILTVSNKKKRLEDLRCGYRNALILTAVFLSIIGIWAAVDFYDFWVDFHYLFFDNDLFFLDPATSIMINMFPENFFSDLVWRIIIVFVAVIVLIGLAFFTASHRKKAEA